MKTAHSKASSAKLAADLIAEEERQIVAVERLLLCRRAKDDLIQFTRLMMPSPEDPEDTTLSRYTDAKHHRIIAAALQEVEKGHILRLIITMPPRAGKSELASKKFIPWLVGRDAYKHVIFASYNETMGEEVGGHVRDLMKSPIYRQIFPGCELKPGSAAKDRVETKEGGILSFVGRGGTITGRGADCLIIDDIVKDSEEANSPATREKTWDWFTKVAMTRLMQTGSRVVIIMCMTGDTPVLMEDGSEKPLKDIRTLDSIATYKDGCITKSTVRNWANQGPDKVFSIRTRDGVTVRANERHPFLVLRAGKEIWLKTAEIKKGDRILRVIGSNGATLPTTKINTDCLQNEKEWVCRTTASTDSKKAKPKGLCNQPPVTYSITHDEVVSIDYGGIEDVFDIQVDDTENFIANGLISHNTRWHEDDLVGRLTDPNNDSYNPEEAKKWKILALPAIAVENDPMGRAVGEPLWPERFTLEFLQNARQLDPRGFSALYQGRPTPEDGEFFKKEWFKTYDPDDLPKNLRKYIASDHAVSTRQDRDATVLLPVGICEDGDIWVLPEVWWRRAQTDAVVEAMLNLMKIHKPLMWWAENGHISKSIGPFLKRRMAEEQVYAAINEVTPTKDKQTRAQSIQGRLAMGKVHFPRFAPWWAEAQNELLKFPGSAHDDFVDALALIGIGLNSQVSASRSSEPINQGAKPGTLGWIKKQSKFENDRRIMSLNSW